LNNDQDKLENRGLNSSIKNYLKLISHFDSEHIYICLPVKNDFGDMLDSDFKEWSEKRNNINQPKQREKIYQQAFDLLRDNKLPKSFSSKIKKLKKIIS